MTPATADVPGDAEFRRLVDGWLQRVAAEPWRFDFYQTLRRFESAFPHLPRLGRAMRPADEPLRIGQPAELTFAPAALHALRLRGDRPPLLQQRIFGLLGPNGPLPTHLTELVRERSHHQGDAALQRFLDTLTHRFALLFYRAWSEAQPTNDLDRPDGRRFGERLGALAGIAEPALSQRDAVGDASKLFFTGRLARHVRDADGLLAWCRSMFDVAVRVEPWCGHWMPLARDERTRIGATRRSSRDGSQLGRGAVLGASVWDVQHKFRIVVGPLRLDRYHDFLPGGADLARLQAIVRQWVGFELAWDLQLILARDDVPPLRLGAAPATATPPATTTATPVPPQRLGRTGWLGRYRRATDADDLLLDVERTLATRRSPAPLSP